MTPSPDSALPSAVSHADKTTRSTPSRSSQTAGLFGRVERYDADGFYGPIRVGVGQALGRPLPPPDLVI